jgi:topoisomerase-4 subunit A
MSQSVLPIDFQQALEERYLAYALSTIKSRSLPDVRDGLKPVHRRLLYAMLQLKLEPSSGFKKCARVVGDVIGKYHPHGELAIYEAMVRMAQVFSSRYPLVEGQGNFGSIDGDSQAAMRYTEARLSKYALLLLGDIENDTVDFQDTYDATDQEPVVLPAAVPNLLANGTEGIAVGMATSIPPHNIIELMDAILALLDNPELDDLSAYVKGPDFPTGGILVEDAANIQAAYKCGKGSFRLRAKWHKEELPHGQYQIVVTEIPYQVQKKLVVERMADLYGDKKLPLIETFQDMSAEDIRLIIVPRSRTISPEHIMESLFKQTDLEVKFHLNMNVLDGNLVPKVMNLKEVLINFAEHRRVVTTRSSTYRLNAIAARLHILEGMLITYLNLDEIIRIIREEDEPKTIIMQRFELSDIQAEAILNMRLRSLKRLEEAHIQKEHAELTAEKAKLEKLLSSKGLMTKQIINDLEKVRKKLLDIDGGRRTEISIAPQIEAFDETSLIEKEQLTILLSQMGWLRATKGHTFESAKYKEGDQARFILHGNNTDKLLCFTTHGKFYTINCDKISRGKGWGDPLRLMVELSDDEEIISAHLYQPDLTFLLVSKNAKGFKVMASDVLAQTRNGKQVMNSISAGFCKPLIHNKIAFLGANRNLLILDQDDIPLMKRGQGVTLQKLKNGNLADIFTFDSTTGLVWNDANSNQKKLARWEVWQGKRASTGRLVISKLWSDQ